MPYFCSNRTRLHPVRTAGESFFINNESKSKNNSATNSHTQIKRDDFQWRKPHRFRFDKNQLFPSKVLLGWYDWCSNWAFCRWFKFWHCHSTVWAWQESKNLKNQSPLKSRIANELGLYSAKDLSSWLEAISVLRNTIAHHSRIWYRIFSKKPTNIRGHRYNWMAQDMTEHQRKRAFGVISCLLYLCNAINPANTIKDDIKNLFRSMPDVPIFMIGFTRGWENNPLWK